MDRQTDLSDSCVKRIPHPHDPAATSSEVTAAPSPSNEIDALREQVAELQAAREAAEARAASAESALHALALSGLDAVSGDDGPRVVCAASVLASADLSMAEMSQFLIDAAELHRLAVLSEAAATIREAQLSGVESLDLRSHAAEWRSAAAPTESAAAASRLLELRVARAAVRDARAAMRVRVAEAIAATAAGALALQTTWPACVCRSRVE
jgi:hypothetical protein